MLDLLWLVPALPLAGVRVLLLLGARLRRDERCVVGVRVGRARRRVDAVLVALASSRAAARTRAFDAGALDLDRRRRTSAPRSRFYLDALSLVMMLRRHRASASSSTSTPPSSWRERRGLQPLLRLHEPVRRLHAHAGAGRQPAAALPGLGRRGAVQLPADRLLVPGPGERRARRARRSSSRASATRPWRSGCSCSSRSSARWTSRS